MTIQKKYTIVVSVLISLILAFFISINLFPRPMFHGDYPYYPDVESITRAADTIIVGEVVTAKNVQKLMVDRTPNKNNKETVPYTISTVRVKEVIKGNVNVGDVITIKQLGDYKNKPEETLHQTDGYLSKATDQLMFLCEYEDSPYSPVNPAQGIVEVKNGTLYSKSRYSLFGYTGTSEAAKNVNSLDKLDTAVMAIKACME